MASEKFLIVTVKGLDKALKRFDEMGKYLVKRSAKGLWAAAKVYQTAARREAPVNTGEMANRIRVTKSKTIAKLSRAGYPSSNVGADELSVIVYIPSTGAGGLESVRNGAVSPAMRSIFVRFGWNAQMIYPKEKGALQWMPHTKWEGSDAYSKTGRLWAVRRKAYRDDYVKRAYDKSLPAMLAQIHRYSTLAVDSFYSGTAFAQDE